jgi:Peptidogalycan biosysnthesis/recognition
VDAKLVNARDGFFPAEPPDLSKQFGVFYSPEYIWAVPATLGAVPGVICILDGGTPCGVLPCLWTNKDTYSFYHPRKLLRDLANRAQVTELSSSVEAAPDSCALVIALASAYKSPFFGAAPEAVNTALVEAERLATEAGTDVACLYFHPEETQVIDVLRSRRYVIASLEANALIYVDAAWRSIDDYFGSVSHGKELRREWRIFHQKGYRVKWEMRPNSDQLKCAARLDARLLQSKGHSLTTDQRLRWYEQIDRSFSGSYAMAFASNSGGDIVGSLLCLIDGSRLVPKAMGLEEPRRDFVYFNLAYYACIQLAIERSLAIVNLGPSSAGPKKRRGARPELLMGGFKLRDVELTAVSSVTTRISQWIHAVWARELSENGVTAEASAT